MKIIKINIKNREEAKKLAGIIAASGKKVWIEEEYIELHLETLIRYNVYLEIKDKDIIEEKT